MGRRSEQRVKISFPVIVRGSDSRGSPFSVTTETYDISCTGACLIGLDHIVDPGKKIEIECQDRKAWFRVQWVGKSGSAKMGRVGVRCLEPGKYIWGVQPKEWEPDTYEPGASVTPAVQPGVSGYAGGSAGNWTGGERRKFLRHACRIEAQVSIAGDSVRLSARVTDISLSGCYVEMLAPLPVDTIIELTLNPGDTTMHATGKVRSSQPGFGMGVLFTGLSPEDFEKLRKFAPPATGVSESARVASHPPPMLPSRGNAPPPVSHPPLESGPPLQPESATEVLEAVVRVLLRKGTLTREELLEELSKPKAVKT